MVVGELTFRRLLQPVFEECESNIFEILFGANILPSKDITELLMVFVALVDYSLEQPKLAEGLLLANEFGEEVHHKVQQ